MAAWLLILVAAAALVVVSTVVVLVRVLSDRAEPGGVIDPHQNAGVRARPGHPERTNIHHSAGDTGPGF